MALELVHRAACRKMALELVHRAACRKKGPAMSHRLWTGYGPAKDRLRTG